MEGIQYGIQSGYNPMTAAAFASQPFASQFGQPQFGQPQFGQQSPAGGGAPFGGLIGSGIPGLLSGQNIGRPPGQVIDGFNGGLQSYNNVDPMTAAHLQQAQLAQQAHLAQQAQLAQLLAQQQFGRTLPFGADPMSAMIAQQRTQFGPPPPFAGWYDANPLNRIDPFTAAYLQQAQIAKLYQQLALQIQLGQQGPYSQGPFGPQFGIAPQPVQTPSGWLGGGFNPWANPQFGASFGRTIPFPHGSAGQFPGY